VLEKVRRQAELIALDIECLNNNDELADREVQVRDITGRQLFSVLIRKLELIAA
jgi:hypothetical protein